MIYRLSLYHQGVHLASVLKDATDPVAAMAECRLFRSLTATVLRNDMGWKVTDDEIERRVSPFDVQLGLFEQGGTH